MKILIADDDAVSRRLLEATLVRSGHEVVAVADGLEALRISMLPNAPRLAVLDWMMPRADGLSVCQKLREHQGLYVYVILLTARQGQQDMIAALDAGADDFLTKPFDAGELRARLRSGERVLALEARLLEAQEALRHQATHDQLTGLWNRAMVLEQLERELIRAKREEQPLAMMLADIDHFKQVNDTYGHLAGDTVLRETAKRFATASRRYDLAGRYGGEEFLMLLPGCDVAGAAVVAERARCLVNSRPVCLGERQLAVSMSLGVSSTSVASTDPAALLQAADEALYRAKALGRDRVEV